MNKRKHFRKQVNVYGIINVNNNTAPVILTDISLIGIRFNIISKKHILNINDTVKLIYTLPIKKVSEITDTIKIVYKDELNGMTIYGAEVILKNEYSSQQKDKGFFIRF